MKKEDSKFLVKVILCVGVIVIGYLYALGNRYQTCSVNNNLMLDTWTGKIYGNNGKQYFELEEKK